MTSKPTGTSLKIGQIITALETKENDKGITRVKFADGWISEKAGDGTVLLELADEDEDDDDSDAETEDTDSEAQSEEAESSDDSVATEEDSEVPKMYKVMQKAVVRSGFKMSSKATGKALKIGDTIVVIEAKENEKGVLRVQFDGGWISEKAGDGTVLLEEHDETESERDKRLRLKKLQKQKAKRKRHTERAEAEREAKAKAERDARELAERLAREESERIAKEEEERRRKEQEEEEARMLAEAQRKAAEAKAIVEAQLVRAEIAKQLDLEKLQRREIEGMILDEKARVTLLLTQIDGEREARLETERRMEEAAAARAEAFAKEEAAQAKAEEERLRREAAEAAERTLWAERLAAFNESGSGSISKHELVNMMAMMGCRGLASDSAAVDSLFELHRTKRRVVDTAPVRQENLQYVIRVSQPEVEARQLAGWNVDANAARWSLQLTPFAKATPESSATITTDIGAGIELKEFKEVYAHLQRIADEEMVALEAEEDAARKAQMETLHRVQQTRRALAAAAAARERALVAEEAEAAAKARQKQAEQERADAEAAEAVAEKARAAAEESLKTALNLALQAGVAQEAAEAMATRAQAETEAALTTEQEAVDKRHAALEVKAAMETQRLAAEQSAKVAKEDYASTIAVSKEEAAARDIALSEAEEARAAEVIEAAKFREAELARLDAEAAAMESKQRSEEFGGYVQEEEAARDAAERAKIAAEAELTAAKRKYPWAELWFAAENGDEQRLQELINGGADVNAKDAGGETAVLKADRAGHEDAVLVLIRAGALVTDLPTESWTMEHVRHLLCC